MYIIDIFLGIIIGTSFAFDIFWGIIPNYVLIAGYAGIVPIMYGIFGWIGILRVTARILIFMVVLFIVYLVGGIGAGDVKLLSLICGVLGFGTGIKFLALVFAIGGGLGFVKLLVRISDHIEKREKITWGKTGIKFSIPVLAGYLVMLLLKGGTV